MAKATIWIAKEHETFWENLPNKGGWINSIITMLKQEHIKLMEAEKHYAKYEEEVVPTKESKAKS